MWTEEKIAELARLIGEKMTATEIANILGFTRNAICGKANRLGLRFISDSPYARHGLLRGAYPSERKPVTLAKSAPRGFIPDLREPPPAGEVAFIDFKPGQCRWFQPGHEGAFGLICARETYPEKSYCKAHYLRSISERERPAVAARMHAFECAEVAA